MSEAEPGGDVQVLCLLAASKYRLRERAVPASTVKAFNAFAVLGDVSRAGGYMPLDLKELGEYHVSVHVMRLPDPCSDAIRRYRSAA